MSFESDSKKAWVLVVVAAVGKTLNDDSSYSADKILFADLSMVKGKTYYTIQAVLAKNLQLKVNSGQINLATMWSDITAALKPYKVPSK
jgi:hypothetical protein